jgi:hypothetical protein
MFESAALTVQLVREAFLYGQFRDLLRTRIHLHRMATPVEMDLTTFTPPRNIVPANFQFVELLPDELRNGKWSFVVQSRYVRALRNVNRGLRIFALVKDSEVVGDMWAITPVPATHPDMDLLGINCKDREAYTFDMLIAPAYRGMNLAVPLQRSLHAQLKAEGYRKVYGYYWDENLPARWMHRLLKFKELPKRDISRFFFFTKSINANHNGVK